MHSLDNIVTTKLKKWQELNAVIASLSQEGVDSFPAQIEGLDGSLASFFVKAYLDEKKSKKYRRLSMEAPPKARAALTFWP